MKQSTNRFRSLAVLAILMCPILAVNASAQVTVPTWSSSFTDTYRPDWPAFPFTMVGGNPASSQTTSVNVYVIPLKVVFPDTTCQSGQYTFDPETVINSNGTVVDNVIQSPIFTPISGYFPEAPNRNTAITWINAFQRGNFWAAVQNNPGYNLGLNVLTPYVAEQTIVLSSFSNGVAVDDPSQEYGGCIGIVDPFWFGGQIVSLLNTLYQQGEIQPTGLAMFVASDVFEGLKQGSFWSAGGAGEHGSTATPDGVGEQTWAWAAYNGYTTAQCTASAQYCTWADTVDFSHEIAEWADDPSGNTPAPCQNRHSFLEVADSLDTQPYYTYPGTNGFTYHVQDVTFLPYFGASTSMSYGQQVTFQGENIPYCGT